LAVVKKAKKKSSRVDTREALYKASIGWAVKKGYSCIREFGLNRRNSRQHLRADLHCLSSRGTIQILELKSCIADLKGDAKMGLYVPYCHRLTVVCDTKTWVWAQDNYKFPTSCGVMILDPESGYLVSVKNTKPMKMTKEAEHESIMRRAYRNGTYTRYTTRRYRVYLDGDK
jgi:hypothetical protein